MPGVRSVALGAWVRAASVHEQRDYHGRVASARAHGVQGHGDADRQATSRSRSRRSAGRSMPIPAREHTAYQARVLDDASPGGRRCPGGSRLSAGAAGRATCASSARSCWRRSARSRTRRTISCSSCITRRCGAPIRTATRSWARARPSASSDVRDLRALHERAYHPGQTGGRRGGNVEHERLARACSTRPAGRRSRADPGRDSRPAAAAPRPRIERHVEREGAQTHVVFGSPAVAHGDPRRYTLALVSTLLGGGMSSRLFQRVREELGLAYAVYTFQIVPRRHRDARRLRRARRPRPAARGGRRHPRGAGARGGRRACRRRRSRPGRISSRDR